MEKDKITLERLKSGEIIRCPRCGKANLEPFGTTADKAHSFSCPQCNFEAHETPAINIE